MLAVRGTHDLLPAAAQAHTSVARVLRRHVEAMGCRELQTPVMEHVAVFARSLGATSDVVSKEMFTLADTSQPTCLRPEGTAGVARAMMQHGMLNAGPQRVYYAGPMFRRERPQKGRYRQFHQFGVECVGVASPLFDAELVHNAWAALTDLRLCAPPQLQLNTLGDVATRAAYSDMLTTYLNGHLDALSTDSRQRVQRGASLRVLDSKAPQDHEVLADAPSLRGALTSEAGHRFDATCAGLEALGVPFTLNPRLVRGLDYYCDTVFEFVCVDGGGGTTRAGTVLAGGRYDGLFEQLGGPRGVPGIGWAAGVERLVALQQGVAPAAPPVVAVIPTPDAAGGGASSRAVQATTLRAVAALRGAGHTVECDWSSRKLSKSLRRVSADDSVDAAVIVGGDEAAAGGVAVRWLRHSQQETVSLQRLPTVLARGPPPQ